MENHTSRADIIKFALNFTKGESNEKMTYIDLINAFERWLETNYLPSSAQLLWYKLIFIFNRAGWSEWVTVDNQRLMSIMQMDSEKTLIRCRDKLIENNFFEYEKGKKGVPNRYKILTVNFTVQMTVETTVQMGVKTTVNVSNIKDKDKEKENNEQKQILLEHFEKIWDIYPHKKGKAKAQELYLQWINGRKISGITSKLTDEQMYYAVLKYAKECEKSGIEQQFIKHGDTFFNKAILDYVEVRSE